MNCIDKFKKWARIILSEDELERMFSRCIKDNFSDSQITKIYECLDYMKKKHENQIRRDNMPYYTHPITVAIFCTDYDNSLETFLAALLHDVVEDSPTPLSEIEELFGGKIAHLVDLLSKEILGVKKELFADYYKNISENFEAKILKACDRLANLHSIHNTDDRERKLRYIEKTYDEILPAIKGIGKPYDRIICITDYLEKILKG